MRPLRERTAAVLALASFPAIIAGSECIACVVEHGKISAFANIAERSQSTYWEVWEICNGALRTRAFRMSPLRERSASALPLASFPAKIAGSQRQVIVVEHGKISAFANIAERSQSTYWEVWEICNGEGVARIDHVRVQRDCAGIGNVAAFAAVVRNDRFA